jgi:hypothetical protein
MKELLFFCVSCLTEKAPFGLLKQKSLGLPFESILAWKLLGLP